MSDEKIPSIRETIEESAKEVEDKLEAAEEPEKEEPASEPERESEDSETEETSADEEPDEESESSSDEVSSDDEEEDIEDQTEEVEEEEPAEEEEELPLAAIPPPASWSGERKEWFGSLPRDAQEEIVRVDKDYRREYTRHSEELANLRKAFEPLQQVISPHAQRLQAMGMSSEQLVAQALEFESWLSRDPKAAINHLMNAHGLNKDALDAEAAPIDPQVNQLKQELQALRQQQQQAHELVAQQSQASLEQLAVDFANERDAEGEMLRPEIHDPDFYQDLAKELELVVNAFPDMQPREKLETAYDRTKKLSNATVLAPKKKPVNSARKNAAKQREKVAKAKKMSTSVNGSGGSPNITPEKPTDIRGLLEQAAAEAGLK